MNLFYAQIVVSPYAYPYNGRERERYEKGLNLPTPNRICHYQVSCVILACGRSMVVNQSLRWLLVAFLLLPGKMSAQAGADVVLPEGTRINLQLNDYLSTKLNNEGEVFTATVAAPVYLKDRVVIPKGSIISGSISRILRPGRFKGKAMMNLSFNSIRLPGTADLPIVATLVRIDREGNGGTKAEGTITAEDSKGKDAAKVATPTLAGAGIGAIVDGGKGAAIGAGIGAVIGLATLARPGKDLEIRRGAAMELVLDRPLSIPFEAVKRAN